VRSCSPPAPGYHPPPNLLNSYVMGTSKHRPPWARTLGVGWLPGVASLVFPWTPSRFVFEMVDLHAI